MNEVHQLANALLTVVFAAAATTIPTINHADSGIRAMDDAPVKARYLRCLDAEIDSGGGC
jgi:hypothetical protein